MYFLSQKDPVECILLTNSEITDETETQIPGYLWWNFFLHNIYDYFSLNYCAESPSFQMYISPSQFSTVNENMKQISDFRTKTETQRELIQITVNHLHV
jgi:hypothetical protein